MFAQIDTMRMARDLGAHAARRQRVIATNVANADTPGYRTRDLPEFEESLRRSSLELRTTRAGHLAAGLSGPPVRAVEAEGEPSPNGNTVSLEDEMVRSADAKREFDLSLAVMQSGLNLMRTAIGRRG
ncbi:FlgB family protein [Paracoccus salipaludis]|uniref:Flagellar basal body rod protein FlgB n=1 Tax=Paracoccus salipaludis TaxID=2032623 RepID=A0A2A2GNF7_9RHOB|nr:FlgB family protein [Paracoccus salipaludis]PAU98730.1 flagellar basal body rod protein FlgB [Paracoccus salipaludis]